MDIVEFVAEAVVVVDVVIAHRVINSVVTAYAKNTVVADVFNVQLKNASTVGV